MAEAIALHIDGMTCASCAEHVREALEKVPGVRSASVSYPCLLYTSPSPRDQRGSRMPSSA